MDKNLKESNEEYVKDLGMVRKIIDWLLVIYLFSDLVVHLYFLNSLWTITTGGFLVEILAIFIFLFGTVSLIPIKPITLFYKNKFNVHWKKWRTCIVIVSLFISDFLFVSIMMHSHKALGYGAPNYGKEYEIDVRDNNSYNEENRYSVLEHSDTPDEVGDNISNASESEDIFYDNNLSATMSSTSYTGTDAIIKAREYFAENEGEYDDLHIEFHDIDIVKDDNSDDYYIRGNGFTPVNSSQCIKVEEESDGIMTYYFLDDHYTEMYIKIVHDNTWDTIYYGEHIDQCNDICGQF